MVALMGEGRDGPGGGLFRVLVFLALMLSGCVPIAHAAMSVGMGAAKEFPLGHIAVMGLCYLLGAVLYTLHWPEKKWPRRFDVWVSAVRILDQENETWEEREGTWLTKMVRFRAQVISCSTCWLP